MTRNVDSTRKAERDVERATAGCASIEALLPGAGCGPVRDRGCGDSACGVRRLGHGQVEHRARPAGRAHAYGSRPRPAFAAAAESASCAARLGAGPEYQPHLAKPR